MKKKERTLGEVLRATGNDMRSQLPGIAANTGRVYAGAGQALVKEAIRLPESFLRAGAFAGKAMGADPSLALASADVLKGARGGVDKIMAPVTDNFHGKAGHYLPLVAGAPGAVRGAVAGARALPKVVSKLRSMFPAKKAPRTPSNPVKPSALPTGNQFNSIKNSALREHLINRNLPTSNVRGRSYEEARRLNPDKVNDADLAEALRALQKDKTASRRDIFTIVDAIKRSNKKK
jgi:hypothetical protein